MVDSNDQVEVCSYDDLFVSAHAGRATMSCPACGPITLPRRAPTLSDFTNAAMEHLSDRHPYTLTLPSGRRPAEVAEESDELEDDVGDDQVVV